MRLTILDGFRGFFLLFMAVVHLDGVVDVTLGSINHHAVGWVEDAQGFVFISGFVVGLVYGGLLARKGEAAMRSSLWARMRLIWTYHAALVLFILASALALQALGVLPNIVGPFRAEPLIFTLLSLGLVSSGTFMDILPLYLWFMLFTPWALVMFRTDRTPVVAVLMVGLWVMAQVGVGPFLVATLEEALGEATGREWIIGLGFNPLGWQVIYFTGLWLGSRAAEGRLDLSPLTGPAARIAFPWVVGLVAALGVLDLVVTRALVSPDLSDRVWGSLLRDNLSDLYLVAFFADLFVIAWLLNAAALWDLGWARAAGRGLQWLFTRPFLVFLGQHSLQVFAWHVAVAYLIDFAVSRDTGGELGGTLILLAGTLSIYVPAWLHARHVAARKAARQASAGAPA
jgi:hypothetical protein